MLALVRKSAASLFGACLLAPFLQALPGGGEEDNCVHLLGYGGPAPSAPQQVHRPTRTSLVAPGSGGGGDLAAGVCAVDNARTNRGSPLKTNADFVPITGDDSLGFYVVYGVKASTTGGVGGNVGIYIFELANNEVLVFGSGYGNIPGANLFDAAYDMERVDQVIRFCMGKDPATTPLRLVAPHGHGDHINPACNRELERLGYRILEIAFHPGDTAIINNMGWTTADRSLFRVLPAGTNCLEQIATYASPLGKIWFFHRPGHTAGSIDLVIDVKNDVGNRFVVRGSQASSPCAPLSGQREIINAHNNVVLLAAPPIAVDITPLVGTSLGGTPMTLTGAGFLAEGAGPHRVLFNGAPAGNVVVLNDTTLTCTTPAGPPGQLVDVAVVNNNGSAPFNSTYFYNAQPVLTSLTPASGDWRGGTITQVRGSGFLLSAGVNEIFFGAAKVTNLSIKSDTLLTCRVPAGSPGATVSVRLSNPNGEATLPDAWRYTGDLAIGGITPPSASPLGGAEVVLTGSSFTGNGATPEVTFGGVSATQVTLLSDTSVRCVVPVGTPGALVDVVLTNSAGSASFPGFRYHATPVLTQVLPAAGNALGGTLVTLSGTGFSNDGAGASQVRFAGIPATQLTILSDTALTCRTPPGDAGTSANITLSNQNGTAALPLAFQYSASLSASSLLPVSGTAQGGTSVTITGTGFLDGPAGPTSVNFGALAAAQVLVLNDTTLTCVAPAGTPLAVVDVQISNANGTVTLPGAYRYHAAPSLVSLSPNHGHAGASTPITINGSGFLDDDAGFGLVVVGGVAASDVSVLNNTTLVCVAPPGVAGTSVDVIYVNQNGTATLTKGFRYHAAPTLVSLTPVSGAAGNTQQITLAGSGFLDDQAGPPTITFGTLPGTAVTVLSDVSVRCRVPAGTPGTRVNVVLNNARGSATLVNGYRYHARPALTALSPNRGTFQGGTLVTLTGTGFQVDGAGANSVTFGGAAASAIVTLNDTTIQCKTPPGTLNAVVDVVVANANGSGTLVKAFSYSVPPPSITQITPASGPAANPGSVQIVGAGFLDNAAGPNTVEFGGQASGIVGVIDDLTLSCQVPVGAPGARVDVVVRNANGTGQLVQGFRYHARPTLTALVPAGGSALGGATIQLSGSGFQVDAAGLNQVTFGGVPASGVSVLGDGSLSCLVPAGTPGATVDVRVTNANGQTDTRPFAYHAQPALTAVSPAFGPATGATRVTLSGSGFQAAGAGTNSVTFGGKQGFNVLVQDDGTLTCDTPRGGPGYVDVVLTNANGSALLPGGFHYGKLPPQILALEPASGPAGGQNLVTVRGRGFQTSGAGLNRVKFGTTLSTNVITVDDETVLCAAPPGTPGALVDVALNNAYGTTTLPQSYRYHALPTLLAVTPPEGEPLGATRVTLSGSGFLNDSPGATTVLFGGARARDVQVLDDTRLVCTAFGGAPGAVLDVTVRNANGSATLPEGYRVVGGPPALVSLLPETGPFLGGTSVLVKGSGFGKGGVRLTFGNVPAQNVVVIDDTQLRCTTPPGTIGQRVTVGLTNKNGSAALIGGYLYTAIQPDLVDSAPRHGPAGGGTSVTLTGSGFAAEGAGVTRVFFGPVPATGVVVHDDATVTCIAPAGGAATLHDVRLENDNGSDFLLGAYRYHARPALTALTPVRGLAAGGTPVTLTGRGFLEDDPGANLVLFGGVAASDVAVLSDTSLTCIAPPGPSGANVDVLLANANGQASLPAAFHYNVSPSLSAVTPARGPAAGGTALTLTGAGFTTDSPGPNLITIGGVAALEIVTVSDTQLTCKTPPGTPGAPREVRVSNANGSASGSFTYFVPPSLTTLSPTRGPATGGTAVTVTGSGFLAAGAGSNLVLFGGVAALDVIELSDTTLTCSAPPGTAGTQVDLTLANQNGTATLPSAFRYHGAPVLSALTPNHGPANGAKITVTGSGFLNDAAGTNTLTFGGLAATQVVVIDDVTLTCRTPAGTPGASVNVTLSNANGTSTLAGGYRYHLEPTITNVVPGRGPSAGGTTLTITGSGFANDEPGTTMVIVGGFGAADVVVNSDTSLTCVTPGGHPGSQANIAVANLNGTATLANAFRYNPLPTLKALAPASGSELGGVLVTLTGTGFQLGSPGTNTVTFGGTPASNVTVLDDTRVTCVAPAGPADTLADVVLSNLNGSASLPAGWRFDPLPVLTSLAPVSGPAQGGTLVTLSGARFADPAAGPTLVLFGGIAASDVLVLDDARVQCRVPAGLGGAQVEVSVVNSIGAAALPTGFRYHALPALTMVDPARGSSAASSSVTLRGSGFVADGAGACSVLFGAVPATGVVVLDDATLTCSVAPQAAGSVVAVSVANLNGLAQLPAAFAFDAPAPVLSALAPSSGPALGGTSVTLTGTGFLAFSAGTNTVTFGGVAATDVSVLADTSLSCSTPPGTVGATVDVRLANVNGSATLPAAFTYLAPKPTLTAVNPASGVAPGGNTVTLAGTGFQANGAGPNTVTFGGAAATNVSVLSDVALTCSVPAGAGGTTVDVQLANANGSVLLAGGYRYHGLPTLTSLTPADGTSLGGTLVTVRGTGFLNDAPGTNVVLFGTTPASSVVVFEDGRLTCRVPSGTAGSIVPVSLSNANGTVELTNAFRYHQKPTITALSPASGSMLGGNRVTVSGSGFTADGAVVNIVAFGGVTGTSVTVVNDSTIQCNVPAGTSGLAVQVTVANVNGTALLPAGYRYHARPTLSAIAPATGPGAGGTSVTLTGSGFQLDNPGTNTVTFGGLAAGAVSVLSDTQLSCTTPAGTAGSSVDVVVANANGNATLFGGFTYDVPIVVAALPSKGTTQGSTPVTLTGAGFHAGIPVTFGGLSAEDVVVLDEHTLTCRTPASPAPRWVDVGVGSGGAARLPLAFQYVAPPGLRAVLPPVGLPQGGTLVVLEGTGFLDEDAGENQVRFGELSALGVSVLDDQHLSCEVPPGVALREVDVSVTNANGTALLTRGFRWQHQLPSDLDHDGRGDLLVSARGSRGAEDSVHVFFGAPLPLADRSTSQPDRTALAERAGTAFGAPVASGDLDGDGIPELLIGASQDGAGAVYVFAGPLAASPVPLLVDAASAVLRGAAGERSFGQALLVRDLDRNGFNDVLVGAEDALYVFRGGPQGLSSVAALTLPAPRAGEGFAESLAVGDLDGDGWPELVVGAPRAARGLDGEQRAKHGAIVQRPGRVSVYRGGPEALGGAPAAPWLTLEGAHDGERFGAALAVGDLDGDGLGELLVGAPENARSGARAGVVLVFAGSSELSGDSQPAAVLAAEGAHDRFGAALQAGDVDGDGQADLFVGAPGHGGMGRAYLFRGGAALADRSAAEADARLAGEEGREGAFGSQVALVDVDGDGRDEMVVTTPALGGDAGRVYVFRGQGRLEHRSAGNDDGTVSGALPGERLGEGPRGRDE